MGRTRLPAFMKILVSLDLPLLRMVPAALLELPQAILN